MSSDSCGEKSALESADSKSPRSAMMPITLRNKRSEDSFSVHHEEDRMMYEVDFSESEDTLPVPIVELPMM